MSKRVLLVVVIAVLVAGAGAVAVQNLGTGDDGGRTPTADREQPSLETMADEVGGELLEYIQRGHSPERSGQIMLVPKPHNFIVGEVDLTLFGSRTPFLNTTHPNPWNYLMRVPVFLYGPGYIKGGQEIYSNADIAGLSSTYAHLLGLEDADTEGPLLEEALEPGIKKPPKLIFTVVIDGGGWNTLQLHPHAWPNMKALYEEGSLYVNGTIGSAPAITGAIHATFGTGVYPRTHGIPGNQLRTPEGEVDDIYLAEADPTYLDARGVADLWDEATNDRAQIATVAFEDWHLGMIGHGSLHGGDKDVAAFWNRDEPSWYTNEDFYELPDYLRNMDISRLAEYEEQLDPRDGLTDGLWFGHDLEELRELTVQPATPAFTRYTGDAVVEVLKNERMGRDDITDIMWVNIKPPDFAGHVWNVISREEEDVLLEADRQIGRFRKVLDKLVGKGNYIFALSADHGQELLPDVTGGWRISATELHGDLTAEFGDVFLKVATGEIFIDEDKAADAGVEIEDIARFVGAYTIGDNVPEAFPGADRVPEARLDEPIFAGAFTTDFIQALSPDDVEKYGESIYDEADLTISPDGPAE